jgi:DNA-binding transcriptional ArsR family regulator
MKLTLKQRLLRYLESRPGVKIASGELQRLTVERTSYSPANATRRLRELAEDGLIKVEQVKGHSHYWYDPPATRQVRRVVIEGGVAREVYETVSTSV